ncbi:MAG: alkaline phosphatase family protein [Planctomycetes bacterium]|nr:alkaline phosphatase family protein [Planctomycetota bacterium]
MLIAAFTAGIVAGLGGSAVTGEEPVVSRIAFGSCIKQDQPTPIWDAVIETNPQLFVFLGDNIYGDTLDIQLLRQKYSQLADQPGLRRLKQTCRILGTWDDHDYGQDDVGAEYPRKRESQQAFLDFFAVPPDDPRRTQEGVYSSQVVGPPGKRIQLILLDGRYFRSPLKTGFKPGEPGDGYRGKYMPNLDPDSTLLGAAQWRWLEGQLRVPAELRIIGSGIQILADEHGSEKWENFPHERQRLLDLIRTSGASGVVLLSGDRHLAEIARLPTASPGTVGYPLYEVTSSSMNAPSGNITKAGARFANEINAYRIGLTFFEVNFGAVLVDWKAADPVVRLQVRDEKGAVVLQQRFPLSQLRSPQAKP